MSAKFSKFVVLALATSFTLSASLSAPSHADDMSILNPMHWMGYDSAAHQNKLAAQAKKNAEMAERQAAKLQRDSDRLSAQAARAQEQAVKARQAADAISASAEQKKKSDAEWDAGNKPPVAPVVKEPTSSADTTVQSMKLSDNSTSADANKVSYLPENNATAPNSMDGQSQSDARSRMLAPDNLKDTLPGTRSDDAVREAEKDRMDQNPNVKSNDKAKGNTSPWNPMSWFNGANHEINKAKPPVTESKTTIDSKPTPTDASGNLMPNETPNPYAPPAIDSRVKPQPGKPAPLKAPQLMHKSMLHPFKHPVAKTEEEVIASAAVAEETVVPAQKAKAAIIETEKGAISIELFPNDAPKTVANFAKLAGEGFYNKGTMRFHRVIPGFVIQTGDPTGTGAGGSKETIPLEAKNKLSHNVKGMVAMARGGDPDSATSQFYITLTPQIALDGKYAIFGKVVGGMDVLDKIVKDDQLYGVRIVEASALTHDPAVKKNLFSGLKPNKTKAMTNKS